MAKDRPGSWPDYHELPQDRPGSLEIALDLPQIAQDRPGSLQIVLDFLFNRLRLRCDRLIRNQ